MKRPSPPALGARFATVRAWVLALAVCLGCFSSPAFAEQGPELIEPFESGYINWTTGRVHARGSAAPEKDPSGRMLPLPGSARAQATANIIGILRQIHITPALTVEDYASTHDVILAGIEKTAQDARVIQQIYTSALDVQVEVQTPVSGGFLQLVLPEHIRQIPKISDLKAKPKSAGKSQNTTPAVNPVPRTGLIIDARGLQVSPLLYPTIVSEQGEEIYSSIFISREFAVQYGVCAYWCEMEAALQDKRVGSNPLVFKALRKEGSKSGRLVISMADTKAIEKVTERHTFLKECRVVIVTDPMPTLAPGAP